MKWVLLLVWVTNGCPITKYIPMGSEEARRTAAYAIGKPTRNHRECDDIMLLKDEAGIGGRLL